MTFTSTRRMCTTRYIITDKLRLNQVLLNIVGNAVKFTPVGSVPSISALKKTPSARSGYATFVFSVKDNGIGMSKDFQAHVFDSFSREQTATRSGIQGTGLGMAISKNIVDMMGGTIAVKSEQGKGSEFTVNPGLQGLYGIGEISADSGPER